MEVRAGKPDLGAINKQTAMSMQRFAQGGCVRGRKKGPKKESLLWGVVSSPPEYNWECEKSTPWGCDGAGFTPAGPGTPEPTHPTAPAAPPKEQGQDGRGEVGGPLSPARGA